MANVMIIAQKEPGQENQVGILEVTSVSNQVHVAVSGSIYAEDAAEMLKKFIGYFEKGHTSFLVDLSAVDYVDSFGLGVLYFIHNRAAEKGGKLSLKGLRGLVRELFELIRLDKIIEIQQ